VALRDPEATWAIIARLPVPLDLVWAERGLVDATARARLAELRPDARAVGLAAGHNIQEDAPAELARTLADLTGLASTRT
jgi:pimeloyl-ACP methyl ester carboxylesterase